MRKFIYFTIAVSGCLNKTQAGKLRLLDSESFSSSFRESRTTAHAFFVRVLLCGFFEAACCFACALTQAPAGFVPAFNYQPFSALGFLLNDAQIELSKIARKNFALSLKRCLEKIFRHRKVARKRDEKNQQKILLRSQARNTARNPKRISQQLPPRLLF